MGENETRVKRTRAFVRSRSLKLAMTLATAAGLFAGEAVAQTSAPTAPLKMRSSFLGYSASVSPRVAYSDNLNLARDDLKNDDVILSTLFTGGAIVSNNRITAILSGNLDFSYFTDRTDFVVNQKVGGAATATIAENLFFFDLAASSSRQLVGDNARFSANINAGRNQRANVHSYSASPYFYRKFSNLSTAELRYRFSQVFIDDSNAVANLAGGNLLNDSDTQEALASFDTGGMFDRVKLTLSAYGNDTNEHGSNVIPSFDYRQGSLTGEGEFALNSKFSLTGAAGYDDVNTDAPAGIFDDNALSGVFWRAGFSAKPGRRTHIKLEYGERYDDNFIDADVSYLVSRNVTFSGGAGRSFRTRAEAVSDQFRRLQRSTLDFADRLREGETLSPDAVIQAATRFSGGGLNAQTVGIGVSDTAFAQLAGVFDELEVTARARYEDSDFGFRTIESFTGKLDVRKRLSRRAMAYADVFYRRVDSTFDPATCNQNPSLFGFDISDPLFNPATSCANLAANDGRTNTVGGTVGASRQIYKNVSAFGEYSHTERFSKNALLEYGENVVVAGVTLSF